MNKERNKLEEIADEYLKEAGFTKGGKNIEHEAFKKKKKQKKFDKQYKGKRFDMKGYVVGSVKKVSGGKADGN